jgi:hypothetical protein
VVNNQPVGTNNYESQPLAAAEPAGRRIHRHRRHWRHWSSARKAAPATANGSGSDNDSAGGDDSEVTATMPVTAADRGLARTETTEGDARMRRGDYGTALRKFRTALMLNPEDDTVREKIDRAERASGAMDDGHADDRSESSIGANSR